MPEIYSYEGDRLQILAQYLADLTMKVEQLGLPKVTAATITQSPIVTTTSQLLIDENLNRKGLIIYNNSANSIYIAYGSPASSSTNMTRILPTFNQFIMEAPIYTGPIYGIRNSGTGRCLITQLT